MLYLIPENLHCVFHFFATMWTEFGISFPPEFWERIGRLGG